MKIQITLKDPDGVYDSIQQAVSRELPEGLSENERPALMEIREELAKEAITKWVEYGEYVTIEIDTDANTCVVVPVK